MKAKRLFWASIIVVELVLVYVLWRPGRQHFARPTHRTAAAPAVTNPPIEETATNRAPVPLSAPKANEAKTARGPATATAGSKTAPHRSATSAAKNPQVAMAPHKPSPIPPVPPPTRSKPPAVNASLISREPVAVKKLTPPPLSPLDSFWCQMSTIDSNCNCKGNEERAANMVPMR